MKPPSTPFAHADYYVLLRQRRLALIAAIIVTSTAVATTSAAVIPNTTFVNPANGNTYLALEATTWVDAQSEAESLGGNLVSINDAAENQFILDTFSSLPQINFNPSFASFWIGLNDVQNEGAFEWASGEPVTFTNFGPGEPNNLINGNEDFVHIFAEDVTFPLSTLLTGQWNDAIGVDPHPAIVEIAIPEPASLWLVGLSGVSLAHRRRR